jgi:hypothetical protein
MSAEKAKRAKSDEIVVFEIRREARCSECNDELGRGRCIRVIDKQPLCLDCADLAHLEFLPRGDAALTRRAKKYSPIYAVVVRWARARKQYERQGLLVTAAAIERAEAECLEDEDLRARRRERAAEKQAVLDQGYTRQMTEAIRRLFPGCPPDEASQIAAHTCERRSGRVGRSAAAKEFDPDAVRLAVIARIRHEHTNYDELLLRHDDRQFARVEVRDRVDAILRQWERG